MTPLNFRLGFAAALLLAAAPLAAGQDTGRSAPLPGGAAPDPEVLRRLAASLGGGSGKLPFDPALLALAQKMFGNGKLPPELLNNPELLKKAQEQMAKMPAEQLEQLKQPHTVAT